MPQAKRHWNTQIPCSRATYTRATRLSSRQTFLNTPPPPKKKRGLNSFFRSLTHRTPRPCQIARTRTRENPKGPAPRTLPLLPPPPAGPDPPSPVKSEPLRFLHPELRLPFPRQRRTGCRSPENRPWIIWSVWI